MSLRDNTRWLGQFLVRPTDDELASLQSAARALETTGDKSLPFVAMANTPAAIENWFFQVDASVSAASTKTGVKFYVPYPVEILSFQPGCETAAGATGTVDLLKDGTTVLAAPVDVKTDLPKGIPTQVVEGSQNVDYGSYLQISAASGSGGAMTGVVACVTVKRR